MSCRRFNLSVGRTLQRHKEMSEIFVKKLDRYVFFNISYFPIWYETTFHRIKNCRQMSTVNLKLVFFIFRSALRRGAKSSSGSKKSGNRSRSTGKSGFQKLRAKGGAGNVTQNKGKSRRIIFKKSATKAPNSVARCFKLTSLGWRVGGQSVKTITN